MTNVQKKGARSGASWLLLIASATIGWHMIAQGMWHAGEATSLLPHPARSMQGDTSERLRAALTNIFIKCHATRQVDESASHFQAAWCDRVTSG
ncbi:hypothetical protein D3876_08165 [Sphingomonas cavernae]|uniref:Uncharacterized protein n=1 Tax=Sphingomonas cavernae TaxID=2320861 RepID=A0A418WJQ2_9SPHN|nr:hypothetical protein D3876_08165 [Sphingomonas cavernae]